MNNYYQSFLKAVENYKAQNFRGYYKGFFTNCCHSSHANPYKIKKIAELDFALSKLGNSSVAYHESRQIIRNFLLEGTFNNHSFNSYLIDELCSNFPHENWLFYHRKETLVIDDIFLQGLLI